MNFDLSQINNGSGDWEVFEVTPHYRRSRLQIQEGKFLVRTEYLGEPELIAQNQELFKESEGKRWGDGQVVARVPLNKFFADLGGKIKEGDKDHLKWWLDSEQARPYRTFKGQIS